MNTIFSHIVQKHFSQEYENIATDALAFILDSSESARNESARSGLMKLLRGIAPDLPSLQFRTQQTDDNARPDMWGFNGIVPRVFIENKFWAGLTENQPVHYLKLLAGYIQPSVLLMVVPAARQETVWRELLRRLEAEKISVTSRDASVGVVRSIKTGIGPILALTSWGKLLSAIDAELTDEPQARNDLLQLRALCDAADNQAFVPISPEHVTDQQTPAFFLQLNSIVQGAVDLAVTEGFLSIKKLLPQSSWERVGRYIRFPGASDVGAWFGTEFTLWKDQGSTPLWLVFTHGGSVFADGEWQRDPEIRVVLESWPATKEFLRFGARTMTAMTSLLSGSNWRLAKKRKPSSPL